MAMDSRIGECLRCGCPYSSTESPRSLANSGYQKDADTIVYFYGTLPVFSHAVDDLKSFRMICAQFFVNGNVKQIELIKTFGLNPLAVKRWVKKYREEGPAGFYQSAKGKRKPRVLTPERLRAVQQRLDGGQEISQIAEELDLKPNTLRKAVLSGRLVNAAKKKRGFRRSSAAAARRRSGRGGTHDQNPTQCRGCRSALGSGHHQCGRPGDGQHRLGRWSGNAIFVMSGRQEWRRVTGLAGVIGSRVVAELREVFPSTAWVITP